MSLSATQLHFAKLYLAAFNRAPELSGLNYWSDEVLVHGKSLQEVGGTIFSLPIVTDIYPASLTDAQFVEAIYQNVFGRASDTDGMTYWTNEIAALRSTFADQGSANAAFEARGQLVMNMINAGLGADEGAEGKAYIENRLEVAEFAVEQQLAQGEDMPVTLLLDIFKNLNADDSGASQGKCEIASYFDDLAPTQQASIDSASDDFGDNQGEIGSGGITDDDSPLLTGTLSAPLALCETLEVYRDGKVVGLAAVNGTQWTFADNGLSVGAHSYSVRVVDMAGNQGVESPAFAMSVQDDVPPPPADTTPPQFVSANISGDEIKLTYDETLNALSDPATSSFNVMVDGQSVQVTHVNALGSKVFLTLSQAVTQGQSVSVSYTPPVSSPIEDEAGNDAAALSTTLVNNMTPPPADTIAPTATISVADIALIAGETSDVTITFSEAVTGLELTDFVVESGTLSALVTNDNINYTAILTPTDNINDSTNLITLGDAVVSDAAGNANIGTTISNNYAVNTSSSDMTAPALLALSVTNSALRSGKITTDFAGNYDEGLSLIQQADGQIVLAGRSDFSLARYNPDGTLDTSFGGGDGKVMIDFDGGDDDGGYSLIQQNSGKLVVAGYANVNGSMTSFALTRYNVDGTLDVNFGIDGKLFAEVSEIRAMGNSLIKQSDGALVVGGTATDVNAGAGGEDFALMRYSADGAVDVGFGNNGVVITNFGNGADHIHSLIQQTDGRLVAAGYATDSSGSLNFALARYNTNGTLDTNFGSSGLVISDFGGVSGDYFQGDRLIQQADGKLVLAGSINDQFALARYNADGTLDTDFGSAGVVTTAFGLGSSGNAFGLILLDDGKLAAAGYADDGSGSYNVALARYNTDGTLDTDFGGGDGLVTTDFGGGFDAGYSLIQRADGKLVVAGKANESSNTNFALASYNIDGTLDTSFGAECLSALSLSSDEDATAGLYDGNTLVGSTLSLSAHVAANLEVNAQASVTQTSLRLTDAANNSSDVTSVSLGTSANDSISLGAAGYAFGFDGNDNLTGSMFACVLVGGSGNDTLDLGIDSAVDRVMFEANGMGYDTINGMIIGASAGDVLDFAAMNLGSMSFNANVLSANPAASTDISGQVVRLVDIAGVPTIASYSTSELYSALNSGGEYANLDMQANSSALVLTAESSDPTTNYLFRVDSTDTGAIGAVELIGIINSVDIDLWTAGNFAF